MKTTVSISIIHLLHYLFQLLFIERGTIFFSHPHFVEIIEKYIKLYNKLIAKT